MVSTHRHDARGLTAYDRFDDAIAKGPVPSTGTVGPGCGVRRSAHSDEEQFDVG